MPDSYERTPDGYGAQRAQQLVWALWVAAASGILVIALASSALRPTAGAASALFVITLLGLGGLAVGAAAGGIWCHRQARAGLRWAAVGAGAVLVILSLLLATTAIGFLLPVVAVVVLLLALLKEK